MKDTNWFIDLIEDPYFCVYCLIVVISILLGLIVWLLK